MKPKAFSFKARKVLRATALAHQITYKKQSFILKRHLAFLAGFAILYVSALALGKRYRTIRCFISRCDVRNSPNTLEEDLCGPKRDYGAELKNICNENENAWKERKLTVVTVVRRHDDEFKLTAKMVLRQSWIAFSWILVLENIQTKAEMRRLRELADSDCRVQLVENAKNGEPFNSKNLALEHVKEQSSPYFRFVQAGEYLDFTTFEKSIWMLESNHNFYMASSFSLFKRDSNEVWKKGLHSGKSLLEDGLDLKNMSAIIRSAVLYSTPCKFETDVFHHLDDWGYHFCLAKEGIWGSTIPEVLSVYVPNTKIEQERQVIENVSTLLRSTYEGLTHSFPVIDAQPSTALESISAETLKNSLRIIRPTILVLIPWMSIGGADLANVRIVKELFDMGYHITIVCSLLDIDHDSMALREQFAPYTRDIFVLPGFLRLVDMPRFLKYIILSREIQKMFLSNSMLGYSLLPWLTQMCPELQIVDYVHNEEEGWNNGGYATYSVIHKQYLHCTFTSSKKAKRFMERRGRSSQDVNVAYLGIDLTEIESVKLQSPQLIREQMNIDKSAVVISYLGRLVHFKRPLLVVEAYRRLLIRISEKMNIPFDKKIILLVGGDGPEMPKISTIAEATTEGEIRVLGGLKHQDLLRYLFITDIFCLPSLAEGIPFTVAEAMALGAVPIVTDRGGFPELLTRNKKHGIILKVTENDELDTELLTSELQKLVLGNGDLQGMRMRGENHIRETFDKGRLIPALVRRILSCPRKKIQFRPSFNDSSLYYGVDHVLRQAAKLSDYHAIQKALEHHK
ncbi:N,N'-diacetylbacillosaminyl-diphospho-undecaprenol alpha-1,3-N-acetylgalactosaminyltransferase [Gracilariopsis chorda]|uniref:N, N'-diacetylbacillosaminyl-diphospho-undecaprenol alpha-1,3-N-acetylgalactosaminyltransferase n=1 Tax=Gracilariopsis chorda TaxID=448386 RepID=A0A2V3IIR3_9FLOR|nr:N,N'-diacetylbacillosaminyl-diphospho-undecaprenol alpha-1,3-N-acetylgalactosaminyltransferase [Gracilariopsis chorda]|eukprot:PXF41962.1 N,N'-diacetylbacillosaminyl-diphospho-undecaprenol alpha-1,3-N-acetylgalactosaminyltransferase [Gracilariopsis chorda]